MKLRSMKIAGLGIMTISLAGFASMEVHAQEATEETDSPVVVLEEEGETLQFEEPPVEFKEEVKEEVKEDVPADPSTIIDEAETVIDQVKEASETALSEANSALDSAKDENVDRKTAADAVRDAYATAEDAAVKFENAESTVQAANNAYQEVVSDYNATVEKYNSDKQAAEDAVTETQNSIDETQQTMDSLQKQIDESWQYVGQDTYSHDYGPKGYSDAKAIADGKEAVENRYKQVKGEPPLVDAEFDGGNRTEYYYTDRDGNWVGTDHYHVDINYNVYCIYDKQSYYNLLMQYAQAQQQLENLQIQLGENQTALENINNSYGDIVAYAEYVQGLKIKVDRIQEKYGKSYDNLVEAYEKLLEAGSFATYKPDTKPENPEDDPKDEPEDEPTIIEIILDQPAVVVDEPTYTRVLVDEQTYQDPENQQEELEEETEEEEETFEEIEDDDMMTFIYGDNAKPNSSNGGSASGDSGDASLDAQDSTGDDSEVTIEEEETPLGITVAGIMARGKWFIALGGVSLAGVGVGFLEFKRRAAMKMIDKLNQ